MQSSFPLEHTWYTAEQAQLWQCTRTTGIYSAEEDLLVSAIEGMRISVGMGIAWMSLERFKGIVYGNTAPLYFDIDYADGVLRRIDRIVVRYDYFTNDTTLQIKKGVFASNPVPPNIERTVGVAFEIAVADVLVERGATEIVQANISDKRLDPELCGIMTDGVTKIPTEMLITQWESWFEHTKSVVNSGAVELSEWIYNFKQGSENGFHTWFNDFKSAETEKANQFTAWVELFKRQADNEWTEFVSSKESSYQQLYDALVLKFQKFYDDKEQEFNEWFDMIRQLLGTEDPVGALAKDILQIKNDIVQMFNFDNWAAMGVAEYTWTERIDNKITEAIRNPVNNHLIATRVNDFSVAGEITITETVFDSDGTTVLRERAITYNKANRKGVVS